MEFITFTDQSIQLAGSNAMARFVFNGKTSVTQDHTLKFGVLRYGEAAQQVRLLARQGYKI